MRELMIPQISFKEPETPQPWLVWGAECRMGRLPQNTQKGLAETLVKGSVSWMALELCHRARLAAAWLSLVGCTR